MILNVTKLNKELNDTKVKVTELSKKMEVDDTKIKELEDKITKLEAEKDDLEKKMAEVKKEETAVVMAVTDSVEKKVIQKLATLGIPEGTVKEEATIVPSMDSKSIYKQYEAITNTQEKIAFFKKNQRAVLNGMKAVHVNENPIAMSLKGTNLKQF